MEFFLYGDKEIGYLASRDKALGRAMEAIGPVRREVQPQLFPALVHAIVGQQISTKAHITIWQRMQEGLGEVSPQAVLACPVEQLQRFGITFKKAAYIRSTAERVLDGRLDIHALPAKTDAEVCAALVQLEGIGIWTAEMLMLFSMQRPDVLSYGDLAILRGMRMLYRHKKITKELFAKYQRRYSPYGSIASLYLWAIAGGAIPGLTDPAPKAVKAVKVAKAPKPQK